MILFLKTIAELILYSISHPFQDDDTETNKKKQVQESVQKENSK